MDEEDHLLRSPHKDDVLFAEDKTLSRMDAAVGQHVGDFTYREGYRRAGRILTEHVAAHGEADFLVFPICHSYRHFVELSLKRLIALGCRVAHREMNPAEAKLQSEKHDLHRLWSTFKTIEQEIIKEADQPPAPPEDMQGIEAYIDQLHRVDPGSFSFRYAVTTKGEATLEGVEQINVGRFCQYMERLCNYLEGFEEYYGHLIQVEQDMYSDCGPGHYYDPGEGY
jgi:hypothetical protein